jgi:DNA-binding ferritin-like protein
MSAPNQLAEIHMQMSQVKDNLDRIEQCTDQAAAAMRQSGKQAPDELRRCVDDMHAQAREVRDLAQSSTDQSQLTSRIDRLEQMGDRAKQACQSAGNAVDPQLRSAVMQAHDQISSLKKQLH